MPEEYHAKLERQAMMAGGQAGGEFLEEIEQTDLSELTVEQWEEFLRRVLKGFSESLQAVYEAEANEQ